MGVFELVGTELTIAGREELVLRRQSRRFGMRWDLGVVGCGRSLMGL